MAEAGLRLDRVIEDRLLGEGTRLLYLEARCLDERRWQDWLELFVENCEFWAPASLSTSSIEYTTDPRREVSLIFYDHRQGLIDRIARISSDEDYAARPLPRTCHAVNNIMLDEGDDRRMRLTASWRVDFYRQRQTGQYFGHYHYELVRPRETWMIAKKKIFVLNDYIPTMLEIFQM